MFDGVDVPRCSAKDSGHHAKACEIMYQNAWFIGK